MFIGSALKLFMVLQQGNRHSVCSGNYRDVEGALPILINGVLHG